MQTNRPPAGLGTNVKLERVIDGDTVVVSITRTFPLRIKDLRCPENKEKGGPEATIALRTLLNSNPDLFIFVEHPEKYLTNISSFDRILGDLYVGDIKVSDWMIANGFGVKGKKEGII